MPALPAHAAGMSVRAGECVQVHTSGVQSNTHSVCSRAVNTHTLTLSGNKNTLSTGRSRHTHSHTHTQSNTHTHTGTPSKAITVRLAARMPLPSSVCTVWQRRRLDSRSPSTGKY